MQNQREEFEYQRAQMEKSYVNLKREKGVLREQSQCLEEMIGKV
jgi:hypothetical protein